jgi:glycosyltransferase involved in cell wall biosynthesis
MRHTHGRRRGRTFTGYRYGGDAMQQVTTDEETETASGAAAYLPAGTTLSIVIPAYNEAVGIRDVLSRVCRDYPDAEIIVVDDGSSDGTGDQLQGLPVRVLRSPYNKGNGASVKAGIRAARGDYVLLLDADGQQEPADIGKLLIHTGVYDLIVGARAKSSQQNHLRAVGNGALEGMASYLAGTRIPDLTSGFRVFRRVVIMEFIHLLPNRYSYPTTSTLAFLKAGYNVTFVPIVANKRHGGASGQKLLQNGVRFILIILRMITLFSPMKIFAPLAGVLFLLGMGYGVYTTATQVHITNSTVLLCLTSIIIFLMGLISEQIAALRFERVERVDELPRSRDMGGPGRGPAPE